MKLVKGTHSLRRVKWSLTKDREEGRGKAAKKQNKKAQQERRRDEGPKRKKKPIRTTKNLCTGLREQPKVEGQERGGGWGTYSSFGGGSSLERNRLLTQKGRKMPWVARRKGFSRGAIYTKGGERLISSQLSQSWGKGET